jgi:phosphoserine aminotransferase
MLILFCDKFDASLPGKLSKYAETTDDMSCLGEADVLLVRSKTKCDKDLLGKAKKARLIIRGGVGLETIDVDYCKQKNIEVKNTPEASSAAVAELAMAFMIASCNQLIEAHNSTRDGKWLKSELKRTELLEKTLGIIGTGRIGQEVARRARAFGMRVIGYDKFMQTAANIEMMKSLDEVLRASDYITLHVPLEKDTKALINKDSIDKMRKGTVIINTARGEVVEEEAVIEALKSGKLGCYCADVFPKEPPENSPLLKTPNVILTPHIGSSSKENLLRIGEIVERQIAEFAKTHGDSLDSGKDAKMERVTNMYAGPGALPLEVLDKVREEIYNIRHAGMSILEISHRSKEYEAIHNEAIDKLKKLLGLGAEYRVLFLGGGASLQFAMLAMNFLPAGASADYIMTGHWSERALAEAQILGKVNIAATTEKDKKYTRIPKQEELKLDPKAVYCHYTTNNTIFGSQWHYTPNAGNVPLVADMSSDFLSRPIEVSPHAMIYAGAQKNAGPAGVTVVIMREDFLARARKDIPIILRYETHAKENSLYNTPPCFGIYTVSLVLDWIIKNGGLAGIQKRNEEKGRLLYGTIDKHADFYNAPVEKDSRSLMNVVFRLPSEALEEEFVNEGRKRKFIGLKGHRSVGGIRVSMYNAISPEQIEDITKFMEEFAQKKAK